MKKRAAVKLSKPGPGTEAAAVQFAEQTTAGSRSVLPPEGTVRLNANVKKDLHLRIKIEAARQGKTIGQLIEEFIETHMPKV